MNQQIQSPRRRHLMIAALASALPGSVFGGLLGAAAADPVHSALRAGDRLVLSGRIVDRHGKPVTDAVVEMLQPHATHSASASTDGDGRFVLAMNASAAQSQIEYRVTGAHQAGV